MRVLLVEDTQALVKAYRQGPQTPEPGAACTGGTSGTSGTQAPAGAGVAP